jgi:hypothetical protein
MTIHCLKEQSNPSASADDIKEYSDNGDHQQGMNQSPNTVGEEANQPEENEQHSDYVQ